MEYYIKDTEKADGPYDMMAIIRKVRNGSVSEHTLIATTVFEEPKPAESYKEFADFFVDDEDAEAAGAPSVRPPRNLAALLAIGVEFLKNNIGATMFSGLFMVAWVLIAMATISQGGIIMPLIGVGACYFLMGGYLYGILRYVRGNPVNPGLIIGIIASTAINMAVVSLVVAILMLPPIFLVSMLGTDMLILTLPILFIFLLIIFTIMSFAPLLITQKKMDFWDAMRESLRVVTMNKGQNLGNVFGLMALNFILCFAMPVVFPITMAALVDLYDEHFG
ncbi:MAG: hypothetical protein MK052_10155 [Alphaproteobacteria bacterium]|nr:hypothetical protein [Alphaproteobacteria bacterium]